jgi:hypothetical protein
MAAFTYGLLKRALVGLENCMYRLMRLLRIA